MWETVVDELEQNSTADYQILESRKFEITKENLIKKHYKKNRQGKADFEKIIQDFHDSLRNNPAPQGSVSVPNFSTRFKSFPDAPELRKMKWSRLPSLQGAARYGRCLYLVFYQRRIICPIWLYTHQEYESQPPSQDMITLIKAMMLYVRTNYPLDVPPDLEDG